MKEIEQEISGKGEQEKKKNWKCRFYFARRFPLLPTPVPLLSCFFIAIDT
jgi:hypothetical protein